MRGDHGANELTGLGGDDILIGRRGDDTLDGGEGDDRLDGSEGDDTLYGGAGEDLLIGSEGDDTLTGGADADVFRFETNGGADTITDFEDGSDLIEIFKVTLPPGGVDVTDIAGGALVDYGSGTVLLSGISAAQITDDDFLITG